MELLLTAQEMAQADRTASEKLGIPAAVLMERAAMAVRDEVYAILGTGRPAAAADSLTAGETCAAGAGAESGRTGDCRENTGTGSGRAFRAAFVCGKGNNGADGACAARLLLEDSTAGGCGHRQVLVRVFTMAPPKEGTPLRAQLHTLHAYGCREEPFSQEALDAFAPDLIVDALFGTGLSRDLEGDTLSAVQGMNRVREQGGAAVLAVDIPSGVSSSDGRILGECVRADETVTFAFYKRGHFLYPGCRACGKVVCRPIGITKKALQAKPEMFTYLPQEDPPERILPERDPAGNKGTNGKVLVIAGSLNVAGACVMAAGAAYRTGAGMVKVLTVRENREILQETLPEALLDTYSGSSAQSAREALQKNLGWAGYALAGPGLSKSEAAKEIVTELLLEAPSKLKGLVLDADAIRLIAENDLYALLRACAESIPVILTPHMAECAALLRIETGELKEDPATWLKNFAKLHHCTILCKDARSTVVSYDERKVYLNTSGTNALSKAGSGDVLAGMVTALLAQGMRAFDAAAAGAYLHGLAGVKAAGLSGDARSVMARDLLRVLEGLPEEFAARS